jgi:DNA-binding transcriptional regulator YhcF (GntR family)
MYSLKLKSSDKTAKYKQIIQAIISDIEQNILKKNEQLPSLNGLSEDNGLSRDTVEKAYRELCKKEYIVSVKGKGFYVNSPENRKTQILLIFNKLSSYKKIIYYAFLKALGEDYSVDLQVHHYKASLLEEIITPNLGKYDYYVVMPMFLREDEEMAVEILEKIPPKQLLFLDNNLPEFNNQIPAVFQNFELDVYEALENANDILSKYQRMVLIFPTEENYPIEIIRGIRSFCNLHHKEIIVKEHFDDEILQKNTVYLVVEEPDLAELIKRLRKTNLKLGSDIGIISFNETTLKELLGITVISTNFEQMGKTAAKLIIDKQNIQIKNPYSMIRRDSV